MERVNVKFEMRAVLFNAIAHLGCGFSEKVKASICVEGIPWSRRWRIFSVITFVLPEPGPARMSWMPQFSKASICLGLRDIREEELLQKGLVLWKITPDNTMSRGILVINQRDQTLYLPIFHEDHEFAYSVLTEAMERWKLRETKSPFNESVDFYAIAGTTERERSKSHHFIGSE